MRRSDDIDATMMTVLIKSQHCATGAECRRNHASRPYSPDLIVRKDKSPYELILFSLGSDIGK